MVASYLVCLVLILSTVITPLKSMEAEDTQYDYIIVGAGSSGCSLAGKILKENPLKKVLLLEAGEKNNSVNSRDFSQAMTLHGGNYDWNYVSEPQASLDGRRVSYNAGKGTGGSSSINGMVWVRGHRKDYDAWAEISGCKHWEFDNVRQIFTEIESYLEGSKELRGQNGPIKVTTKWSRESRIAQDLILTLQEKGYKYNADYNAFSQHGINFTQLNVDNNGERQDAYSCYLGSLEDSNLEVKTSCFIDTLELSGKGSSLLVTGVIFFEDGKKVTKKGNEVILCAGTLNSPLILLRSGIGDSDTLRSHGITPRLHLPGVGQNLHDHPITPVVRTLKKTNPLHVTVMDNSFFLDEDGKTTDNGSAPAFEIQSYYMRNNPMYPPSTYAFGIINLHPTSRGSVSLPSLGHSESAATFKHSFHPLSTPVLSYGFAPHTSGSSVATANEKGGGDKPPQIDPHFLSTQIDRERQLRGLKIAIGILKEFTESSDWLGEQIFPRPEDDDEVLSRYISQTTIGDFHPVGTCKMGKRTDADAVVDGELRVIGIGNLRVADASIMPKIVSGNTNAASMMIGIMCSNFLNH